MFFDLWPLTWHRQTGFSFFRNTLPSVEGIYVFPHFCSDQFFFVHYPNKLIFLYSLLSRLHLCVIVIISLDYFYNKDLRTNSSSSLHLFIIIDPSPDKTYFREVDCAPDIVDQGRFIVIFQLTLVSGQE
jgi:hypothetical protein